MNVIGIYISARLLCLFWAKKIGMSFKKWHAHSALGSHMCMHHHDKARQVYGLFNQNNSVNLGINGLGGKIDSELLYQNWWCFCHLFELITLSFRATLKQWRQCTSRQLSRLKKVFSELSKNFGYFQLSSLTTVTFSAT